MIGLPAAQTGLPKATQVNPGSVKAGSGNYIVIGCVTSNSQGASPTFVITDSRTTPPVQYRLVGDPVILRIHVGHTLEVGGRITQVSGRGIRGIPTLNVQSLIYISQTCVKVQ
jgi:hypothetical protein